MLDVWKPEPGCWKQISLEVSDLSATVESLQLEGVHFRKDVAVPEWPLWLANTTI